jgi:hypothetical protein
MDRWGFEVVGEPGFTPLDERTVQALAGAAAGAGEKPELENIEDNRIDFMILHCPEGTPDSFVHAVADGIREALIEALEKFDAEALGERKPRP